MNARLPVRRCATPCGDPGVPGGYAAVAPPDGLHVPMCRPRAAALVYAVVRHREGA